MKAIAGAILVAGGTIGHAIAWSAGSSRGDQISAQIPAIIAMIVGGIILFVGLAAEWSVAARHSK